MKRLLFKGLFLFFAGTVTILNVRGSFKSSSTTVILQTSQQERIAENSIYMTTKFNATPGFLATFRFAVAYTPAVLNAVATATKGGIEIPEATSYTQLQRDLKMSKLDSE